MSKPDTNKDYNLNIILQRLWRHLSDGGLVSTVSKQFAAVKTNSERVDFVYKLIEEYGLFPEPTEDGKSAEFSAKLRQIGNERFKIRRNEEALEFYTKSVATAEGGSENLALAFANRSAVLFERGMYKECLVDIERAFQNNYPENLKHKLQTRKERSENLAPKQTPFDYCTPIPSIPKDNQNASILCASDAIKIENSKHLGRHIVANKDIKIGDILAIEKPLCHILIEQYYNHCHECLQLCYNLMPCLRCTKALYCSEECMNQASVYHKFECRILATTRHMKIDKLKLLPLKMALIFGGEQYEELEKQEHGTEVYRSDRYREIHNLVANTESRTVADLFDRSVTAAVLFNLVKNHTDFFADPQRSEDTFKELLLLHLQTGACNFHEISELTRNKDGIYEQEEIGAGAFSFLSMFNHSCCPNVTRHCYGPVVVVRAISSIKKGEQCYDNYGYHHALLAKNHRQEKLKKQYFFDCNCMACETDYPLYTDLPEVKMGEGISLTDIEKLQNGDVECADTILKETLSILASLEEHKMSKNFSEMQEILKQCFALQGNIRRPL